MAEEDAADFADGTGVAIDRFTRTEPASRRSMDSKVDERRQRREIVELQS